MREEEKWEERSRLTSSRWSWVMKARGKVEVRRERKEGGVDELDSNRTLELKLAAKKVGMQAPRKTKIVTKRLRRCRRQVPL